MGVEAVPAAAALPAIREAAEDQAGHQVPQNRAGALLPVAVKAVQAAGDQVKDGKRRIACRVKGI